MFEGEGSIAGETGTVEKSLGGRWTKTEEQMGRVVMLGDGRVPTSGKARRAKRALCHDWRRSLMCWLHNHAVACIRRHPIFPSRQSERVRCTLVVLATARQPTS